MDLWACCGISSEQLLRLVPDAVCEISIKPMAVTRRRDRCVIVRKRSDDVSVMTLVNIQRIGAPNAARRR